MGTMITLDVAGMSIDWSKNSIGNDHSSLFQAGDVKRVRSDQINYEYFVERGESPEAMEMALTRQLKDIVPRLQLMGFTIQNAKSEYDEVARKYQEDQTFLEDDEEPIDLMTFDQFCAFVIAHPIADLASKFVESLDEEEIRGRFADEKITSRIPRTDYDDDSSYSERSYFGKIISILHPYALLRLLAENPANLEAEVVWQYGPLVEAGWARASEFVPVIHRAQSFLIATEGTSDAHVLRRAFTILRPDIADFFRFIDVRESYPFTGTGNLLRFAEGLIEIDIQNRIVFLFDNDAEGWHAHSRLRARTIPANMCSMALPDLEVFRSFPARGPEGVTAADINRRAAAIECYLDLKQPDLPEPRVLWTNYKKDSDSYQGALENKDDYLKAFLKQTRESISSGRYDVSKLRIVLDAIVRECTAIASSEASPESMLEGVSRLG
jgi:hypothetical protein